MDMSAHMHTMGPKDDISSKNMMVMTFGDWSDYRLKLLFDSWNIEEKWQFLLSWMFVVMAVIFYHFLKYEEGNIQEKLFKSIRPGSIENGDGTLLKSKKDNGGNSAQSFKRLRLTHSFIAGLTYAVMSSSLNILNCVLTPFCCGALTARFDAYAGRYDIQSASLFGTNHWVCDRRLFVFLSKKIEH